MTRRRKLNSTLTHQFCLVYRTLIKVEINSSDETGHLIVQLTYTQKQKCGSDCGVFAIAFAFHAAMGDNISGLQIDQRLKMKCLRKQKFTPFPNLDKQGKIPKKVCTKKIDVDCTCLMPDTYGEMVQCENCHKWFNIKCVGLLTLNSQLYVMTNGHALLVCETEIFIQPFSIPFLDSAFIPSPPPPPSITFTFNTPEVNQNETYL